MERTELTDDDRDRIGRVFETHRGYVEALAVQQVGRTDAPDVVAEVAVRLCTGLNGLREPGAIRAWIYRVTLSAARDVHADRTRFERTRTQLAAVSRPGPVLDPDEFVRARRREAAVQRAVDRLDSRTKSLIRNKCDPARVFVLNGADRTALSRGRARLRHLLRQDPRLNE